MNSNNISTISRKENAIAWVCLISAGLIEIIWAYFMKQSYGFTKPIPTIITVFFLFLSFFLLERGIRTFGIGLSYAVFTGIGIAGTTVLGIFFLDEGASAAKIISLSILVIGLLGLKFCEKNNGRNDSENNMKKEGDKK